MWAYLQVTLETVALRAVPAVLAAAVQPSPAHGASTVDICRPGLQAGCPRGDLFQASPSSWLAASRTVLGLGSITPSALCGVFSLCVSVCVSESQSL